MSSGSKLVMVTGLAGFVVACSGGGQTIGTDVPQVEDGSGGQDAAVDVPAAPEVVPDERSVPETVEEAEAGPIGCAPGDGCFGDNCAQNSDCQSGWCVDHLGDGVCSQLCQDECPAGWACKLLTGTEPDMVWLCVSNYSNLCKPCSSKDDCRNAAGIEDACVSYGAEGSFCGGLCGDTSQCPWGFVCKEVTSVDGVITKQCVASGGVCPCSQRSIALGLWTGCTTTNEFGTCEGKRVCEDEGLSTCDAAQPVEETCNGVDDDCDGDADEPKQVGGDYVNLCDDGNACTKDQCQGQAGCGHEPLTEGECVDGDACTIGDHCEDGVCKGLPIACNDFNACTDDSCDGKGGCTNEPNHDPCDDGNPCTVADACSQGKCQGYDVQCDCSQDADCKALEDGNLCNGVLFCDKTKVPYACAIKPGSIVECDEAPGGPVCLHAECDPSTGKCGSVPVNEGTACDDGKPCSVGEKCAAGACGGGVPMACGDDNPCTDDFCDPESGCIHTANSKACTDGNACTLPDVCADGACKGGPVQSCDDANECTDDSCDPLTGCKNKPNSKVCDDGNACTTGDVCVAGKCAGKIAVDCDDKNPCTADTCLPGGGCLSTPIAAACDDKNPCTVNDSCVNGACTAGPALDCDDKNPCTKDSCAPQGGCQHVPQEGACDDGNACTDGDVCDQGKCVYVAVKTCDDANVCTTDLCDPTTGCVHKLNTVPCDDGNICTLSDKCELGQCKGSSQLTCNDSNSCTDDSCNPKAGCEFVPNQKGCDDGNACTTGDKCGSGKCGGTLLSCDDSNPCTDDSCDFATGCVHTANNLTCDDGNACTAGEACAAGECGGGKAVNCNDGNVCTTDTCDSKSGCGHQNNTEPCNDGNACTLKDACADGVCKGANPLSCDDLSLCTTDSCDPVAGCQHVPVPDNQNCGAAMHCEAGKCVPDCVLQHGTSTLSYTGNVQTFTVPACIESLTIEAFGAQGGKNNPCSQTGGKGARMKGSFTVTPGETFSVVVGGKGLNRGSDPANNSGTGGGGSFVWRPAGKVLMLAAGGGGGGAICESGGGPAYAQGKPGVTSTSGTSDTTNSQPGGSNGADGSGGCGGKGWLNAMNDPSGYGSGGEQGGYGGGGTVGLSHGGGGGGGYSGGGCKPYSGYPAGAGGGGGSYNGGSGTDGAEGVQSGDGKVVFTW